MVQRLHCDLCRKEIPENDTVMAGMIAKKLESVHWLKKSNEKKNGSDVLDLCRSCKDKVESYLLSLSIKKEHQAEVN